MARVAKGETHVALLRGINVGGKNRLPMKDLAALFEGAGATEVSTYIQSGNVVYRVSKAQARRIGSEVSREIREQHGLDVPVVTRSSDEFAELARRHPLSKGADPKSLHVVFLTEVPDRTRVLELDAERSPPDRFEVKGREVYLNCPNGVARSKLTNAYFDRVLGTTSTVRNWRTVGELLSMLQRPTG
jgi:uncharacterized protein (DUF1697 family)